jgi:hypothetical protein
MASLMSKTVAELTGSELIQILKDFIVSAPPQMTKTKGGKAKKVKKEKDPDAPKKEVSEGVRLWNEEVAEVLEEMLVMDLMAHKILVAEVEVVTIHFL